MQSLAGMSSAPVGRKAAAFRSHCQREWQALVDSLRLWPQQPRIVKLILQGKADKQIAREMGLRVPTVRAHLTRVFQKLGVTDRVGVVVRVFAGASAMPEPDERT